MWYNSYKISTIRQIYSITGGIIIFNILLLNDGLDIDHENIKSLLPEKASKANIIEVANVDDAEYLFNKTKIHMLIVTKPVDFPYKNKNDFLTLNNYGKFTRIKYSDIIFIESDKHRCIIHKTDNSSIIIPIPISQVIDMTKNSPLIRCHRSYIINMEKISTIDKTTATWIVKFNKSNKLAFISRSYRPEIIKFLNK